MVFLFLENGGCSKKVIHDYLVIKLKEITLHKLIVVRYLDIAAVNFIHITFL